MESINSGPKGLGGWLVLPAIGMVILPLRSLVIIGRDFVPMFTQGHWELLTTPGSEVYHWLWRWALTYELVGNAVMTVFNLLLLTLFFMKSHLFPKLYILFSALAVLYIGIDLVLVINIPDAAGMVAHDVTMDLVRSSLAAAIWIPYMLVSKRVKNTFVKPPVAKIDSAVSDVTPPPVAP